jgi:hypothetical protein
MDPELISVIDAARELGMRKQSLFKVIKRLGITTTKQRSPEHGNQHVAYITKASLELIVREGLARRNAEERGSETDALLETDHGVFYLVQLEPEHDPGRFKVGFTSNMAERLRVHRCSAPFASVLSTWPCRQLWEKTAIHCVAQDCEQIHTEVFRTGDIIQVKGKCDEFFSLMPAIGETRGAD